ncbi:uncharacterized protein LOC118435892 [Folsomia candida]|uniref:uncharacterized protein LOC118435892 n=1 Tax=Folsomia candida TaxID=158441 RepID=UPI001604F896|nr:uncharacterized protein LOC118435892 [Folsomia candida]
MNALSIPSLNESLLVVVNASRNYQDGGRPTLLPLDLGDIELFPEQWSDNASTVVVQGRRRAVKRSKNAGENCENDSDSDYVPPPSEDSHQSELSDTVVFQKSDDLGELIQLAEGEKKLTKICFVCQKEFYTTSGLANHMSRHDKDAKSTKELNRRRRMRGIEYVGYSKVEATSPGVANIVQVKKTPKSGRRLGPVCTSCTKSKIRKCIHFSEEVRKELFDNFWLSMDWKAKQSYVRGLVDIIQVACRTTQHPSKRKVTFVYHLPIRAGLKVKVCRTMFLATLGIGKKTVDELGTESG